MDLDITSLHTRVLIYTGIVTISMSNSLLLLHTLFHGVIELCRLRLTSRCLVFCTDNFHCERYRFLVDGILC